MSAPSEARRFIGSGSVVRTMHVPILKGRMAGLFEIAGFCDINASAAGKLASEAFQEAEGIFVLAGGCEKVLPAGNRELITEHAKKMVELFGKPGGGLIANSYPISTVRNTRKKLGLV